MLRKSDASIDIPSKVSSENFAGTKKMWEANAMAKPLKDIAVPPKMYSLNRKPELPLDIRLEVLNKHNEEVSTKLLDLDFVVRQTQVDLENLCDRSKNNNNYLKDLIQKIHVSKESNEASEERLNRLSDKLMEKLEVHQRFNSSLEAEMLPRFEAIEALVKESVSTMTKAISEGATFPELRDDICARIGADLKALTELHSELKQETFSKAELSALVEGLLVGNTQKFEEMVQRQADVHKAGLETLSDNVIQKLGDAQTRISVEESLESLAEGIKGLSVKLESDAADRMTTKHDLSQQIESIVSEITASKAAALTGFDMVAARTMEQATSNTDGITKLLHEEAEKILEGTNSANKTIQELTSFIKETQTSSHIAVCEGLHSLQLNFTELKKLVDTGVHEANHRSAVDLTKQNHAAVTDDLQAVGDALKVGIGNLHTSVSSMHDATTKTVDESVRLALSSLKADLDAHSTLQLANERLASEKSLLEKDNATKDSLIEKLQAELRLKGLENEQLSERVADIEDLRKEQRDLLAEIKQLVAQKVALDTTMGNLQGVYRTRFAEFQELSDSHSQLQARISGLVLENYKNIFTSTTMMALSKKLSESNRASSPYVEASSGMDGLSPLRESRSFSNILKHGSPLKKTRIVSSPHFDALPPRLVMAPPIDENDKENTLP
ncbi:hypothetical protein BABINDRAFT_163513 [Babjeviella inositovora NRRL Y-12698]|uniref:Uncharacterized protein n=1 Tax=Babjeviella inositovora NRRL Y-12698 TaxID=984486 RepID=A0A1E3QKI8_9ASCO|nr:uncharacterized protein BABINDRAFT_163513 [Babjeviella inositovora NRRL Y-12698]ODQ77507.1 hypothetical protein BABINDRAFT_163513 [Babjeviella inositovora NRRL Y-12698]